MLPVVVANDNRRPAGRLHGDTLELRLEVRMATWHPESDSGPAIDVAAFAEVGHPPEIPAPLIRVPEGTIIVASVRNALGDSAITIHGLLARPAAAGDSVVLRPGESRTVRFAVGRAGTYLYHAVLGRHTSFRPNGVRQDDEREQLGGALVVDPPGGSPPDRILVMNVWGQTLDPEDYRNALTINGRSWPYTERMNALVGDSVRWRIVNASDRNHPMHLHGFYFRVDARGDLLADTLYRPDDRRLAVTEGMAPLSTLTMVFSPNRPGNWLFHCHIGFHVVPDTRLDPPVDGSHDRMAHDPLVHMAGLVTGITVRPGTAFRAPLRRNPKVLRLYIQEGTRRAHAPRALGFVLQRDTREPAADSVETPGSVLTLVRGEPTDVMVINRLREPAAVHWHGIELESYSDGVAGWSGVGTVMAPSIEPGDSFLAHLTTPRAGTFMYHTHMNDIEQLSSGLYGGIVVLEPGQRLDPSRDHLYVAGWDGMELPRRVIVNGDSLPGPLNLAAGVAHRFRFVNIGVALRFPFAIYAGSELARWRPLAKDGAEFPSGPAVPGRAVRVLQVGETFDAAFEPPPGEYRLVIGPPAKPYYVQRLIVR